MSLEESITDLAGSNADLASANRELANAMREYAGVMRSIASGNPSAIIAPTGGDAASDAPAATGTTRKRRTKAEMGAAAKAEADALAGKGGSEPDAFGEGEEEADPFADDSAPPAKKELTKDDIRKLVMGVKGKNEAHARKLLEHLGVKTLGTIDPKDYPKVQELAGKAGVTLDNADSFIKA